ncbi:hypothetical protein JYT13_00115 [Mariprofundus ferrooxydans]|nr:hypothetical protein [Mariprofundus ferrooxydans]
MTSLFQYRGISDSLLRVNTLAALEEVTIKRDEFEEMLQFSRLMSQLKQNTDYIAALKVQLPATANAMHDEASMLMGYDFHLTDDGPRLIEINNNAGGLYVGGNQWMKQPAIAELVGTLQERLLQMFPHAWQCIAIMDEDVANQYMYPEMQFYADLLRQDGRVIFLVSPEDIQLKDDGLYVENQRLDGIYNRHTDFYLDTPELAHIRTALMAGQVSLNPHPRSYALLGDKSRMVDWWHKGLLDDCLSSDDVAFIRSVVPEIHLLSACDKAQLWQERKAWVFKPAARHGGKGVVLGKAMSRKRFESLDNESTVVQSYVPPSQIEHDDVSYKFDVRLYMHGETLIAVAGRLWRGQLTNFREDGSGWVSLHI